MSRKLDYRWNLRQVMATREMFQTTDLLEPLAQREIRLSSSQVYRLVVERPERLSLKILMALLDILDCAMDDLIERAGVPGSPRRDCGTRLARLLTAARTTKASNSTGRACYETAPRAVAPGQSSRSAILAHSRLSASTPASAIHAA